MSQFQKSLGQEAEIRTSKPESLYKDIDKITPKNDALEKKLLTAGRVRINWVMRRLKEQVALKLWFRWLGLALFLTGMVRSISFAMQKGSLN